MQGWAGQRQREVVVERRFAAKAKERGKGLGTQASLPRRAFGASGREVVWDRVVVSQPAACRTHVSKAPNEVTAKFPLLFAR